MSNSPSFADMRVLRNTILLLGILTILAPACKDSDRERSNNDSPRIVKNIKIASPKSNTKFQLGDSIPFELEAKEQRIDSVLLEHAGSSLLFNEANFTYLPKGKTGSQRIKLTVFFAGEVETHYARVTLLSDVEPENFGYQIINTLPHDKEAFTQGLFFKDDTLVESTGQIGTSWISKVDLMTGSKILQKNLSNDYFGEGSCLWKDQYIQLTWTSQIGFVYDHNFNHKRTFNYTHEGWGITSWGDTLYVSDGSNTVHMIDPRDFSEIGKLEVYDHERSVSQLNELEMIDGLLYANVYLTDLIIAIDPLTGKVLKKINMSGLLSSGESRQADVLNGIAVRPTDGAVFVTGKLWPKIFEVRFLPL